VDLATTILPKWRTDLAGRFEHYSDFGNTGTGKFSTRYDFSDDFGLRATVQSGFRAPSLAQENYALTQTGPALFPGGPHLVQIQYPVNSPGALALGSRPLKAERSESYSVGLVAEPIADLRLTIDAYQINLHDRITNSGLLFLGFNPTGTAFDVASFFTNGLSTRLRGVDLTSKYTTQLGDSWGLIRWSLNATYNKTTITSILPTPAALQALGLTLFDPETLGNITSATPNAKAILGADYVNGKWTVTVHETLLGDAHTYATADFVNYSYEKFSFRAMTDLELSYEATHHVTLTVGASNLFNVYPNRVNPNDLGPSVGAIYPTWSPISINGGFYYGRVALGF
jgi:iron complex outermembrane recepter protein